MKAQGASTFVTLNTDKTCLNVTDWAEPRGKTCWVRVVLQIPRQVFSMSRRTLHQRMVLAGFCLAALLVLAPLGRAQTKSIRKLVYKENPGYPMTLREAHIGGVVRLEIVISAKGSVDSVVPVGGNPVLVEAASAAVRRWKYAPADAETKTQVEFTFDPKH